MYNIGNTPLVRARELERALDTKGEIYLKLEMHNPAGSSKDRAVYYMLSQMEKRGEIKKGATVAESTSGNTGIALAFLAPLMGYKAAVVMPDSMSEERRKIIKDYGALLILTPGKSGVSASLQAAQELVKEGGVMLGQFDNPDNIMAHYTATGPEILSQLPDIDCFVAAFGTGGTVSGVGRFLKENKKSVRVCAVEPEESPLVTKGYSAPHGIQGIGADFLPRNFKREYVDTVLTANTEEAYRMCRLLCSCEGIRAGISSGAALSAAAALAREEKGKFAVLLPDGGEKYISTGLFDGM